MMKLGSELVTKMVIAAVAAVVFVCVIASASRETSFEI